MTRGKKCLLVVAVLVAGACGAPAEAPDVEDGVPIVNQRGEHVGTADPEAFDRAVQGGSPAPVFHDGRHVGHFGQDGYEPLE